MGYINGGIKAPLVNLGWDAPAGQMYSTVDDLLKVATYVMCNYSIIIFALEFIFQ